MGFLNKLKEKSERAAQIAEKMSTTITTQVGNTVETITKAVVTTVTEEVRDKRYAICVACPEFIEMTGQCRKCGCFMKVKTIIESAQCPLKKW